MCYGGTAINNLLPKKEQFYDKSIEFPDYDFFSKTPLKHAKELADLYFKKGYENTEAKSGIHTGTFKVYVNFIPVADISYFPEKIFDKVWEKRKTIKEISYLPPNFLRLLMYLELSRPKGHIQRWEKVFKRLTKLNRVYPIKTKKCNFFKNSSIKNSKKNLYNKIIKNTIIENKGVFFGSLANENFFKINKKLSKKYKSFKINYYDVLHKNPRTLVERIKINLEKKKIQNIKIKKIKGLGEIISEHYKILINNKIVCFIYKPLGCHSYNIIKKYGKEIRIATIDTQLMYYLFFLYMKKPYFDENKIFCIAEYLFRIQKQNRLRQNGLLKRFNYKCIGQQETFESLRLKKYNLHKTIKKGAPEWDFYFLRYYPNEIKSKKAGKIKKKSKTNKNSKTKKNYNTIKSKKSKKSKKKKKIFKGWLGNIGY